MATTPGGPDPNQSAAAGAESGKATVQSLKEALRLSGDYGNQLKLNITDLQKTLDMYAKIDARLATLEKTSINIKEINKEIRAGAQKQYLANKKVADLQSDMGDMEKEVANNFIKNLDTRQKLERELIKAQKAGLGDQAASITNILKGVEQKIAVQQEELDINQLSYVAAKKEQQVADQTLESLKKQLSIEKQISSQIGFTGAVFGNFAKKLGIGDRYYEQMVAKARQLNEEGKKFGFGEKLKVLKNAAGGALGELASDPIAMLGAAIPLVGSVFSALWSGLKTAFNFILGIQDKTVKFGRALGVSTEQATLLKKQFGIINLTNGDLLVNTDKLIDSQTELVGLLGTTNVLTSEQLSTNIKLNELLGLDAQARASIAQSSVITGKSSQEITESVLAQVEGLKAATGIGLDYRQVLDQASKLGGALGLQFAQFPGKIAKALVVTKSFGLECSFLDFESSISKEFEAQVLLGKQINLTKARQAFLDNDLATAAAEISKSAGSYLDFNKMNRIQQEAIAAAVGMNRDQLGDMLKNQLYLDKLGAKETASSTEKLKLAKERFKTEEEINRQLGEGAYQNLVTMSATEKIAAFIDKIKSSIGDFLTNSGIIDKLTEVFNWLSKPENIRTAIGMVRDFAYALTHMIGVLIKGITHIPFLFSDADRTAVSNFFDEAEGSIGSMGTGGMSDAATLNTGTVASQRVPASNATNTATAAANAQAPILANITVTAMMNNEKVGEGVKQYFLSPGQR